MALPSDLVAHYSSKIFQTRVFALTLIGTLLGASTEWIKGVQESNFMGFLLILMVTSLGESNRRYTHSYLCACRASARNGPDADFWRRFRGMNERPWAGDTWDTRLAQFLLYWSTYIPGAVGGWYLIWRGEGPVAIGWIGIAVSVCAPVWWFCLAPPRREKKARDESATEPAEEAGGVANVAAQGPAKRSD